MIGTNIWIHETTLDRGAKTEERRGFSKYSSSDKIKGIMGETYEKYGKRK
jgi:hypothetical protein